MLDALGHSAYFSILDLASGFWQVEVTPKDREKIAFTTPCGIYEFVVMPFSLINAPATFQRVIDRALTKSSGNPYSYTSMILLSSRKPTENTWNISGTFSWLKINLEKCDFFRTRLAFLGHVIMVEGILSDPSKIEKVQLCPVTQDKTNVCTFLELASYYRRFIKGKPLHNLTKRDVPFKWECKHQLAFNTLKRYLTTAPIMVYPDFTRQFTLATDAFN